MSRRQPSQPGSGTNGRYKARPRHRQRRETPRTGKRHAVGRKTGRQMQKTPVNQTGASLHCHVLTLSRLRTRFQNVVPA